MPGRAGRMRTVVGAGLTMLGAVAGPSTLAGQDARPAGSVRADGERGVTPEAAAYLEEAIDTIRANAFRTDRVDWTAVRAAAFDSAAGARVPVDTYRAIRYVLRSLGDHHSFLQLSAELRERERARLRERGLLVEGGDVPASGAPASPFQERRQPEGHLHEEAGRRIARVVVPQSGALSTDELAAGIHAHVAELAALEPCGWIVDLRGNGGGNMWPMLAGIGPLLGTGSPGSFVGRDGPFGRWYYRNGAAGMNGEGGTESFVGASVPDPVRIAGRPPVAVLIDAGTGSSGEALAIAFKGRERTRFFGVPTAGVSTSNDGFRLSDGANLVVTVGVDVDRTGRQYPLDVEPDETVSGAGGGEADPQLRAALAWLSDRDACSR